MVYNIDTIRVTTRGLCEALAELLINALGETKVKFEFWIITNHEVREKKKKEKVMYIGVDEINEKIKQYFI